MKNKLKELGLDLSVKSILCDFELNILKSIDNMLDCDILGCFFHLKKCFQRRVERKGFKTRYETDEFFNEFINQCSALSHLPTEDIERGLEEINKKFIFEDERGEEFKKDFIGYINDFWTEKRPLRLRLSNLRKVLVKINNLRTHNFCQKAT